MSSPYAALPERAFWRPAVAARSAFDLDAIWTPKHALRASDRFVTFGSCFAQHIGRALTERGFLWHDAEPAPEGLSAANARAFNYGIFSARTGNIYTTAILEQWARWATGAPVPEEEWSGNQRSFDPFRPAIEPDGFASPAEMRASRAVAIAAFQACIRAADVFVFTLGLTEGWRHRSGGFHYPMCPGTIAGTFDPAEHAFVNEGFVEIGDRLNRAMELMLSVNPGLRFLLTVSPVPLTATMSGQHVMVATMESKSILRAVAGETARARADTDYFPSYELINSPIMRGMYFRPNGRDVHPQGVTAVMSHFFKSVGVQAGPAATAAPSRGARPAAGPPASRGDVICEEELLAAFGEPG